jgi:hypothetical protein
VDDLFTLVVSTEFAVQGVLAYINHKSTNHTGSAGVPTTVESGGTSSITVA